jgi:hypothetical protein
LKKPAAAARGSKRLGASGWVGENTGFFNSFQATR